MITTADDSYTFRDPGRVESGQWAANGLCRAAVRGGKFAVLFPALANADETQPRRPQP